ncbi:FAD-dependent pyridine nucleotide-disulfide oxidoreductase [uncultured Paludibacter sp.]|nr:FAD-dependent pyridine nucleotide-disulfide oxidoreductase [uncultured Paludibacter sp.]
MKKVLILGGGFAGVQAAIDLQKSKLFDVTLVSDRDFLYLYPVSIWIPVHKINEKDVKISLQKISKKHQFNLTIDKVTGIKASENLVICNSQTLSYDYLIVAFGADKLTLKGMEYTTTICGKPEQTLELQTQLDNLIAKGSGKIAIGFGGNPKDKSAVRGGPAFEFVFNLDNYLRRKGIRNNFELTMFAPMAEPGAKMGKAALNAMPKMLKSKKIETRYSKKITEFIADGIVFEDNTKLESDLIMFISAGTGSAVLKNTDLPLSEADFVKINDYCQIPEFPNIFAIGDAAALEGPDWIAKQGHVAEIMGSNAAYNIIQIEKSSPKRKGYQKDLSIICVMDMGDGAAFVYRNGKTEIMIPMPVVGHWMKKAWGVYSKWTKLKLLPKII